MRRITLLRAAGWLNILLAVGHILCMPWLNVAFRFYGIDGMMGDIASHGACLPYLLTVVIACCFALAGLYAFSAEGDLRRLPLLWLGLFTIAGVFLFRAVIGCVKVGCTGEYSVAALSSVVIAGGIGLLYLIGGLKKLRCKA